jgi:hypothetical protein
MANPNRPRDTKQLAAMIVTLSTGEESEPEMNFKQKAGQKGGLKGGRREPKTHAWDRSHDQTSKKTIVKFLEDSARRVLSEYQDGAFPSIHSANQRLLKEYRKPRSRYRLALHVLQFRADAQKPSVYSGNGGRRN